MADNYNDAGRRVQMATEMQNRAEGNARAGDRMIKNGNENLQNFQKMNQMIDSQPGLRELLQKQQSHIMFPDIINGMDPKQAMMDSPEGIGEGAETKFNSIKQLLQAKGILTGDN